MKIKNFSSVFFFWVGYIIAFVFVITPLYAVLDDCEKVIEELEEQITDAQLEALMDLHSLKEVADPDSAKNLAAAHPFIVMDASSRALAIIQFGGKPREVADPLNPFGKTKLYPVFSQGTGLSEGKRIIGQLGGIAQLVEVIRNGGDQLPVLVGAPGTGKSEFIAIAAMIIKKLSTVHPDFFSYTYTWRNLVSIPSVKEVVLTLKPDSEPVYPCPLHESPFVLLPKEDQARVLQMTKDKVNQMVGKEALPVRRLCPACEWIRGEILLHYAKKKGAKLTSKEIIEALNQHVEIRRIIFDDSHSPIIDVQPKDVDWGGLVSTKNPLIATFKGTQHPLAYMYDGKLLRGNGGFVFLDEVARNPLDFRNVMLRATQSHELAVGGMPLTPFNAVLIGGTNITTIEDLSAVKDNLATIDRFRVIPFTWTTKPHEVAQLILHVVSKSQSLVQAQLGRIEEKDGESKPRGTVVLPASNALEVMDQNLLFPFADPGESLKGPDRRYKLWVKRAEERKVHISPHALLFMSQIVAATRMSTDMEAAKKLTPPNEPFNILHSPLFHNIVRRLKVYMGKEKPLQSEWIELLEVVRRLGEGSFGMSARDAQRWFEDSIARADHPAQGFCITPQVIILVLRDLLTQKTIRYADNDTRIRWEQYLQAISENLLAPEISLDIQTALAHDTGIVDNAYEEMIYEMMALHSDPNARFYEHKRRGEKNKPVDFKRFEGVSALYRQQRGRPMSFDQIAVQHMHGWVPGKTTAAVQDEGLREAIVTYFAGKTAEVVNIGKILDFFNTSEGDEKTRQVAMGFSGIMKDGLGYCDHCMKQALEFSKYIQNRKAQVVPTGDQ